MSLLRWIGEKNGIITAGCPVSAHVQRAIEIAFDRCSSACEPAIRLNLAEIDALIEVLLLEIKAKALELPPSVDRRHPNTVETLYHCDIYLLTKHSFWEALPTRVAYGHPSIVVSAFALYHFDCFLDRMQAGYAADAIDHLAIAFEAIEDAGYHRGWQNRGVYVGEDHSMQSSRGGTIRQKPMNELRDWTLARYKSTGGDWTKIAKSAESLASEVIAKAPEFGAKFKEDADPVERIYEWLRDERSKILKIKT